MRRLLIDKDPAEFQTLALYVEADATRLCYQPLGEPLNFVQMQARRQPLNLPDHTHFAAELANLGVSVRLTLAWQQREFWVLVRQQRHDRGDTVLKLISGYVPAAQVALPLLTAIQEVAEECLVENAGKWLSGRYAETWLPAPYAEALRYQERPVFNLLPLCGAAQPVLCGEQPLLERPQAYVHLPTASLQLVYDMRLSLPSQVAAPSLYHVDEQLHDGRLLAWLDTEQADLFLLEMIEGRPSKRLYQLRAGQLKAVSPRGLWLSESFARQRGWVVTQERVRFSDWWRRQRP